MDNQIISLSVDLHRDFNDRLGEPLINHCRRMANRALIFKWDDLIVKGCYLHDVLNLHYGTYYETMDMIKAVDERVAWLADKAAKKEMESWPQYYYRVLTVPEATKLIWLDMTDELPIADFEQYHRFIDYLPRFYRKLFIEKN